LHHITANFFSAPKPTVGVDSNANGYESRPKRRRSAHIAPKTAALMSWKSYIRTGVLPDRNQFLKINYDSSSQQRFKSNTAAQSQHQHQPPSKDFRIATVSHNASSASN
jgi:hypothetical protein